jgi:ribosomal protein S18 acetylase RimI-like enzyme
VAVTKLRTDPATSWIEDVYTAPEARRRGYARLLVTHASALGAAENPELTFIVADDNDWPKDLYRRIGFERGPSTETTVPWPEPLGAQAGSVMRGPPVG